jgi:hypothetical protein
MRDEPFIDVAAFERDGLWDTLDAAWAPFAAAVAVRRGPFHTPSVATVAEGSVPRLRTVVLRGCDVAAWTLRFHTDRRSAKFSELAIRPCVALHVYSQKAKLQVRLEGLAVLHCDDVVADDAWAASLPSSRECYAQLMAPGLVQDVPVPDRVPEGSAHGTAQIGRENFCAVVVQVQTLEWLYLRAAGHRRARFTRDAPAGKISASWLAP